MNDAPDPTKEDLVRSLQHQRTSVLSVVDGLDEEAWHTSVVPSGWTPAGVVQHLGDAERHWFQQVVTGSEVDLSWDEGRPPYDPLAPFICDRPAVEVVAYYRDQCRRSDAVLVENPINRDTPRPARGPRDRVRALGGVAHDRGDRRPLRPPRDCS